MLPSATPHRLRRAEAPGSSSSGGGEAASHSTNGGRNSPTTSCSSSGALYGASGSIQRRLRDKFERFEILGIGDPAMPAADQRAVALRFVRKSRAQVGDGFPGKYKDRHTAKTRALTDLRLREETTVQNIIDERHMMSDATALARASVGSCERSLCYRAILYYITYITTTIILDILDTTY